MKLKGALLLSAFLACVAMQNVTLACSRVLYSDPTQSVIVGRNMDWMEDMQTNLVVYPRGILRDGQAPDNSLKWTSNYGSMVATAYGSITTDGMNEKGFAAHLLSLPESDYGQRNSQLPGMSVTMWAQYYLDNFATVADAVNFTEANSFQLIPFYLDKLQKYVNLHLAIEDASGDSAIIEYVNGALHVYHDKSYTVLTNSPTYDQQLLNLKQYQGFGGDLPLPGSTLPQDRFVRAAYYSTHLPDPQSNQEEVTDIFGVMQNVSQPETAATPDRPYQAGTIWRVVADLSHRVYYFNSTTRFNTVWARLGDFNLQVGAPVMLLDLVGNPRFAGDVSKKFLPA